ncbi:MAG: cell division protein ZapA [Ancalomicrobiaceae bacterium]|nr:cell division protein ZapA [Ancalomicrobiaceae bacterium]
MTSTESTQVSVTINGRVYRMACEEGQQAQLLALAAKLDGLIHQLRGSFGEIGDQRLTVMAAIMAMDEMAELNRQIRALEAENRALKETRAMLVEERDRVERNVAQALETAAGRVEAIAAAITRAKPAT